VAPDYDARRYGWGGLELAGSVMLLPFESLVFAILLIVLGVILLARELQSRNA
jgi:hypothetical protein